LSSDGDGGKGLGIECTRRHVLPRFHRSGLYLEWRGTSIDREMLVIDAVLTRFSAERVAGAVDVRPGWTESGRKRGETSVAREAL